MIPSTRIYEIATLSRRSIKTKKKWSTLESRSNRPTLWSSEVPPFEPGNHPYLEFGKRKNAISNTFCGGTTTKTMSQLWRLCRKWLHFITTKVMACSKLEALLPILPNFVCPSPLVQNFILSQRATKKCWGKSAKTWLVTIVFTRKTWWFASPQTLANQALRLKSANFTCILWARRCLLNFVLNTNLTKTCKDSNTNKTRNFENTLFIIFN